MNHFTNRQVAGLCVLSIGFGAVFAPPLKSVAQPPENTSTNPELSETPQPLATPPASSSPVRSTSAIGPITGQGTVGFISKFTGANAIGNSVVFENGGKIGIGTTTPAGLLSVKGVAPNIYPLYVLNASAGNAIFGSSNGGIGVYGQHTSTGGDQAGVFGETGSNSVNAAGVLGTVLPTSPGVNSAGVRGVSKSTGASGFGVYGTHAGLGSGVYGTSPNGNGVLGDSVSAIGVRGRHTLNSGTTPGVSGETNSASPDAKGVQGIVNPTAPGALATGVRGINNGTNANGSGIYGTHAGGGVGVLGESGAGIGVQGRHTLTSGTTPGVLGETESTSSSAVGLLGRVNTISAGADSIGVSGVNNGTGGLGIGVRGRHAGGGWGVQGTAPTGRGVYGFSASGAGIYGSTNTGYAGQFVGRVAVTGNLSVSGTLSKGAGSFKIDHPQRPSTEYLSHSFVESPDMMNVYNGNATTNSKGEAWIKLPSYFQSLNRDFRYQLTCVGAPALVYVAQEIHGNRFKIAGGKPGMKVSWQVTGIRNDVYARQNRIAVEQTKAANDRGRYLYPAGFGFGKDKQIGDSSPRLAQR